MFKVYSGGSILSVSTVVSVSLSVSCDRLQQMIVLQ